jgi:glycosyltransferase involved in cell wall biosynthesis
MGSLHILHFTLGFYPAIAWGGPVKNVYSLCQELIRRGHEITIYCTNLINKHSKIYPKTQIKEIDGIRVIYLDTWNIPFWPGTLGPIWISELPNLLLKEITHFDIVHIHGYRNLTNIPIVKAAIRHHIPYIIQPHGTLPVILNTLLIKHLYDRLLGSYELRRLSYLIATQESEMKQALNRGIPAEKIKIIRNGLRADYGVSWPENHKRGIREKFNLPLDRPIILFLGRVNKKKGADMLIEAFSMMELPAPILVIAGPDDGHLYELIKMVDRLGLKDRVFFTGLLCPEDVSMAYQEAEIFVLPCRADTFPMTIIEACQAQLPMVVTDTCEVADLIKDRIADIVPFDAKAFSSAMTGLLLDRQRYSRYQENCIQMMQDTFSIETEVNKLEILYHEILNPLPKPFNNYSI